MKHQTYEPYIVSHICHDTYLRGDTWGRIAIGQAIAKKLGIPFYKTDQTDYPKYITPLEDEMDSARAFIKAYAQRHGPALLNIGFLRDADALSNETTFIESIQHDKKPLVPHTLTPENLKTYGEEFYQKTGIPRSKNIIAVMCATEPKSNRMKKRIAQKLSSTALNTPDVALYMCASKRFNDRTIEKMMDRIEGRSMLSAIFKKRARNKTHAWLFEKAANQNTYNPYRGLIATAAKIIVIGDSHSMVSESLINGRQVGLYNPSYFLRENLYNQGLCYDFETAAADYQPKAIAPPNVTNNVASILIEKHSLRQKLLKLQERKSHLRQFYQRPQSIARPQMDLQA